MTVVRDYTWEESDDEERETKRSTLFWVYNGACFLLSYMLSNLNMSFLWYAFWDANRRIYLMRQLSNSIEIDFLKKNETDVRMPTLNFMDVKSLATWLEARKLILATGSRFQIRIQYYVTYFIIVCGLMLSLVFSVASTFVNSSIFTTEQWVSFLGFTHLLLVFLLMILLPVSYLNEEMLEQIKKLLYVRETYSRIVKDNGLIQANPNTVKSRIQQIAIRQLRNATKELSGDEKLERMKEYAG